MDVRYVEEVGMETNQNRRNKVQKHKESSMKIRFRMEKKIS